MAASADLYTLHAKALAELEPDLILTQDLCRGVALPSDQVENALDYLGCRADVLSLDPRSLDDVLDSILAVGQRTGVPERATRLAGELRARLARMPQQSPGSAARRSPSSNGQTRRSLPVTGGAVLYGEGVRQSVAMLAALGEIAVSLGLPGGWDVGGEQPGLHLVHRTSRGQRG